MPQTGVEHMGGRGSQDVILPKVQIYLCDPFQGRENWRNQNARRIDAVQTEKKLLKSVVLFDVYEGKNLPEGKKSYAVNFILQDEEKTLNDKQIDAIMKKLIANLTGKLNAELR